MEKFKSMATYYKVNIMDMEIDWLPNIFKTLDSVEL